MNDALPGRMLVIDDEPDIRRLISLSLDRIGIDVHTAGNLAQARELLTAYSFDACLTDMRLPDGSGLDFLREVQASHPRMPIAVITAHGQLDSAVKAMRNGAFDFVSKPVDIGVLRRLALQALSLRVPPCAPGTSGPVPCTTGTSFETGSQGPARARDAEHRTGQCTAENDAPRPGASTGREKPSGSTERTLRDGHRFVGEAGPVRSLRHRIEKVARTNAPVWITGESGTGKELIARLIHANGARADGPFVAINCGAIPSELMESELFGHRKGSFTGAHRDKDGLFRVAESGTLFLDEIAELPLHMQVKLLRVIQERSVRPVGENEEVPIDVRILSASHEDLGVLVESSRFRQDLYYRLNVIAIRAPALRDRVGDIPVLSRTILSTLQGPGGSDAPTLSEAALRKLETHRFPGNVRELENVLERACALRTGPNIEFDDIEFDEPSTPIDPPSDEEGAAPRRPDDRDPAVGTSSPPARSCGFQNDKQRILEALDRTHWNRRRAAQSLGLTYRQLRYRIAQLGLDDHDEAA